jgi:hypothetical protein
MRLRKSLSYSTLPLNQKKVFEIFAWQKFQTLSFG